jgi:DNA-binding CsgD family transcriptional regulator
MPAISQCDFKAVLACIGRLNECEDPGQFPQLALRELHKLVGADSGTFNYLAPAIPKVIAVALPEIPNFDRRTRTFAQHLCQHAIFQYYIATGDIGAFKISDFQTVREFHSLPLYKNLYHDLRYEDQFAFMLFPPASEVIGVGLARNRRTFTERDREILNLIRPHMAQAYRRAENFSRLKRLAGGRDLNESRARVAMVQLDTANRALQFGVHAEEWLRRFFPGRPRDPAGLPDEVADWIRLGGAVPSSRKNSARSASMLVRTCDGERLRLGIYPGPRGAGRILVLELETLPEAARAALGKQLTRREIEVLLEVEHGKTNEEAAVALGISPLTVRTHLENIFEKLRVPSRTAAVTRFRNACSAR